VAVGAGVAETVGGASTVGVTVADAVGAMAVNVDRTIAASVGSGVKADSSGGNRAYQIEARASDRRQPIRS
jgi:hypothetical protein